jgi:hypothetical protein
LYAAEVVGRRIKVLMDGKGQPLSCNANGRATNRAAAAHNSTWAPALLSAFDAPSCTHLVTYAPPSPSSSSHRQQRAPEWLRLDMHRFQWVDAPHPNAAPNATYANSPKEDDAVGHRLRVFWPGGLA